DHGGDRVPVVEADRFRTLQRVRINVTLAAIVERGIGDTTVAGAEVDSDRIEGLHLPTLPRTAGRPTPERSGPDAALLRVIGNAKPVLYGDCAAGTAVIRNCVRLW